MAKFLESNRIYLKKLSVEDDLSNYLELVNDTKELVYIDELGRFPLNIDDLRKYIKNVDGLFLSIFNQNNEHVGNIRVTSIHTINRYCSFGILLHKKHRSNGFAKDASSLVIKHIFRELNANRIELFVVEDNTPAIRLYESLGFKKEGCKREAIWINGEYKNLIIYSMLYSEFKEV